MTEEKPTVCECPNCREPAKKVGNIITCEKCDARFEIKKTGAARVKATGEIEELRNRVDVLEAAILPDDEPEPAANQDQDQDQAADQDQDQPTGEPEENILPG